MSTKYLGETFDIHCGGVDNMFPHHENEIAQTEAATGKRFVHYWMHNEHLQVEGKRMAKSLRNFYTLRDLLAKGLDPLAIRYLLLSTHYRQQFNFTFESLDAAKSAIERLVNVQRRLKDARGEGDPKRVNELIERVHECFGDAMDDDLNISVALASLFDFARDVNNMLDSGVVSDIEGKRISALIEDLDRVLGVLPKAKEEGLPKGVEELIRRRDEARKAKDWKTADDVRAQLRAMGIVLEDTTTGVRWKRERA
jgi:cysteinyl-tRNA synthetase